MTFARQLIALLIGAGACAADPATQGSAARPRGAPAVTASPSATAPGPGQAAALVTPSEIACTLRTERWPLENREEGGGVHHLRFGPGKPAFAQLFQASDVQLILPAARSSAGGFLLLDAQGVFLNAHLEASEMPLYPARALVLSGVFVPNSERRLSWRSARAGRVTVVGYAGPRLRPRGDGIAGELECANLSLGSVLIEESDIDKTIGVPSDALDARAPRLWLQKGTIPLSASPNGEVVADIDVVEPRDDSLLLRPVRVLATSKGWTRIALRPFGGVLFGWVRSEHLTQARDVIDLSHDVSSVVIRKRPPGGQFFACDHDLRLFAHAAGERHQVGTVRAKTPFERLHTASEWTTVDFAGEGVFTLETTSFLVETAAQASCLRAPAAKP